MSRPEAEVTFAAELRLFLAPRHRDGRVVVACDEVSSQGHVVESLGVPLPEAGALAVNGRPVTDRHRLAAGDAAAVGAVTRPQAVPSPRFVLDVHLGTLASREPGARTRPSPGAGPVARCTGAVRTASGCNGSSTRRSRSSPRRAADKDPVWAAKPALFSST